MAIIFKKVGVNPHDENGSRIITEHGKVGGAAKPKHNESLTSNFVFHLHASHASASRLVQLIEDAKKYLAKHSNCNYTLSYTVPEKCVQSLLIFLGTN